MREFCNYHPAVLFLYFLAVILITCINLNPVTVFLAFVIAFAYNAILKGRDTLLKNIFIMPIMFLGMALINPAFNHRGVTILAYFPSGNPLTAESICFGLIASGMVLSVILFFSCFNEVMTSDKIIYLFGRVSPSLSLIFSMTLRAVPKFIRQFKEVSKVQKVTGKSQENRIKSGFSTMSGVTTWILEDAIETADSMKSRGYGLPKRTAYSIYSFTKRDKQAIMFLIITILYIVLGASLRTLSFTCFPSIKFAKVSPYSVSVFFAEFLLMSMPIMIEITEYIKWKHIE
ncbi:MAG: energy-coupling factor transporter transmembrane protein EcfT [Clostridia bacterium]|nr:energy-coupling factor transporter transmembrane protein EcfT [Clostridia bacterium]